MSKANKSGQDHASEDIRPKSGVFVWLRARFFAGLVIATPIVIPILVLIWLVNLVDERIKPIVRSAIPPQVRDMGLWNISIDSLINFIPGLGVLIAIIALTLLGTFAANLLGRSIIKFGERIVENVPIVRTLYTPLRQLVEIFSDKESTSFKEVVLVEYPKEGTWAVGFLTSKARDEVAARLGVDFLGVFVPTTPNPTSGFLIYVPEEKVKHLTMSIEDGAKLIVSAGVVLPKQPEERSDTGSV